MVPGVSKAQSALVWKARTAPRGAEPAAVFFLLRQDERVEQPVEEAARGGVGEDNRAEVDPVDRPVGAEGGPAETGDDLFPGDALEQVIAEPHGDALSLGLLVGLFQADGDAADPQPQSLAVGELLRKLDVEGELGADDDAGARGEKGPAGGGV